MFIGLLLFCAAMLFSLLLHAIVRNRFWHSRGIVGPTPWPFIGNLWQLFVSNPASIRQLHEWTQVYGPRYGIQMGHCHVLVSAEPKLVRQVLVTKYNNFQCHLISPIAADLLSNPILTVFDVYGQRWKRIRSCIAPFLSAANLRLWAPVVWDSVKTNVDALAQASANWQPIELYSHFGELTTDIVARLALGQSGSKQFHSDFSELARGSQKRFNRNVFEIAAWLSPWFGAKIVRPIFLWSGLWRREPVLHLYANLNACLLERKNRRSLNMKGKMNGKMEDDGMKPLIDQILDYETGDYAQLLSANGDRASAKLQTPERKLVWEEIVMQLLVFILAGFGVANSMSITFLMLALYPDVQTKLRAEIERVCVNEVPTSEELDQLEYAHAVQMETLRLLPVASAATARLCTEDIRLDDDLFLEKGTAVWPDIIALHRDPTVWGPDALEFRPERWLQKEEQQQQNGTTNKAMVAAAFYGFGEGPRMCVGKRLAIMQEKMAMVQVFRAFRLHPVDEINQKDNVLNSLTGHAVVAHESVLVRLEPLTKLK